MYMDEARQAILISTEARTVEHWILLYIVYYLCIWVEIFIVIKTLLVSANIPSTY